MSLPKSERIILFNITGVTIGRDSKFNYSYICLDKSREYSKDIEVEVLGESTKTDLITEEGMKQFIGTDKRGELYELGIKGSSLINMRDIRSSVKVEKKTKKEEDDSSDE